MSKEEKVYSFHHLHTKGTY